MTIPTRRIIVSSCTSRCMPLSHGAVTDHGVTGRCHDKSMMDDATGSARKINPNQPKSIQINNPVGGFPHICGSLAGIRHSADKLPIRGFGADFENREIPTFLLGDFSQRPRNVTNSRPRRGRIPPNHEFRRVLPRLCGRSAPGTTHRRKPRIAFGHCRLTRRNRPDTQPHRHYRNLWSKTAPDSIRHRRRHMDEENTKAPGFGGFRMLKLRLT